MSIVNSIRQAYLKGIPLTSAQRHYLWMNRNRLEPGLEAIAYYYLGKAQALGASQSFIKPHKILSPADIELMKRRLKLMLASAGHGIEISLTPAQFIALKNTVGELLFFHGNHVLTGAPFFAGGIPRVDIFQWGNLMGIVKYEELLGEKGIDGNILIYFEDLGDRTLLQALHDYDFKMLEARRKVEEADFQHTPSPIDIPPPGLLLRPRPF